MFKLGYFSPKTLKNFLPAANANTRLWYEYAKNVFRVGYKIEHNSSVFTPLSVGIDSS